MTTTTIGILALQGDVREHRAAFERCGAATTAVRLPRDFEDIDGLVIPGGESTTIGRLLRVFKLLDPLQSRLREGMGCFLTCAGLILLSRTVLDGRADQLALGALDIVVRRNAYGRQIDSFEADLDIPLLGAPALRAVFIRAPQIVSSGTDVEVIARYGDNPVVVAQGAHLGLTFHPEMTDDNRLHRLFLRRLAAASPPTCVPKLRLTDETVVNG